MIDVAGEATASALSSYLCAFGYSVVFPQTAAQRVDGAEPTIVFLDIDRIAGSTIEIHSDVRPVVVAVTSIGEEQADAFIANGSVDTAISRPILRTEIEVLLRRIVAGNSRLHSDSRIPRKTRMFPKFQNLRVLVCRRQRR